MNTRPKEEWQVCPEYVIKQLGHISEELVKIESFTKLGMTPFDNSALQFKNSEFEVEAYNWNEDFNQEYNFRWYDIKIKWYKYCGRSTYINKDISSQESINMAKDCIVSINK